jgi:hypothetical protein
VNNSDGTSPKIIKGKNGTQQKDSRFKNGGHELQNSTDKTKDNSKSLLTGIDSSSPRNV